MKYFNILALCIGCFIAGAYLKPEYNIPRYYWVIYAAMMIVNTIGLLVQLIPKKKDMF